MNKELIKNELQWLLEAINEQHDAIQRHGDKIPQIEFDILMENIRKFYDYMLLFKRTSDSHFSFEKIGKNKIETLTPSPSVPPPSPSVPLSSPPVPKKAVKSREIDLFAAQESSFNTKLKDAREQTFSPKISSERFQTLKSAISINEKFMFINELFDGNLREYNETIETLNGFKNLDQAAEFLDLMLKKNFWDTGSSAFNKLKELIERQHKP
jgi:hypothetical protein